VTGVTLWNSEIGKSSFNSKMRNSKIDGICHGNVVAMVKVMTMVMV